MKKTSQLSKKAKKSTNDEFPLSSDCRVVQERVKFAYSLIYSLFGPHEVTFERVNIICEMIERSD